MKKIVIASLWVALSFASVGSVLAAEEGGAEPFAGDWSGSWVGPSTGTFEMTIAQDAEGGLSGSISPQPSGGEAYTESFTSVIVEEGQLTVTFLHSGAVVTMTGALVDAGSEGAYEANSGGQVAESGTWKAARP